MSWSKTLDTSKPLGSEDPKTTDDYFRDDKVALVERLAQDHFFPLTDSGGEDAGTQIANVSAGEHKKITLRGQDEAGEDVAAPTAVAEKYFFYARYVDTGDDKTLELFCKDPDGNEIQLTKGGKFFIANDTYLVARNEDNDGTVDLIKAGKNEADDTEVAILPDKVRTATNAAPLEDTAIANKKYVDDEDAFGAWASKSVDTVYEALTDGFVIAWTLTLNTNTGFAILTDASNPPTTIRITSRAQSYAGVAGNYLCATIPVKKGDYWKVLNISADFGAQSGIWWMPIGTEDPE